MVEVPELPGCMADGKTYEEAVSNAQVIISEWIETAKMLGSRPDTQLKAATSNPLLIDISISI